VGGQLDRRYYLMSKKVGRLTVLREGARTTIVHADPCIQITADMLESTRRGYTSATLDGDLLRIEGANRTVVYRIGDMVPGLDAYWAEWPD
jgi:hypothetical protein